MPRAMYNSLNIDYCRNSKKPLLKAEIDDKGCIEDLDSHLMVDFANRFIGGGVMNMGMV